jgi:hypothetical protein
MGPVDPAEILISLQHYGQRCQNGVQGGVITVVPNALKFASGGFLFEL